MNFKSLIHFSFVLLVFSYIFRSLYMCMTDSICYTDCIILCSPFFFYGFRGIFVKYLIRKRTQFISDPASNLFCTFIREKSLKHICGHDPFFMTFEPFLLALRVKPDLLASGCHVPQRNCSVALSLVTPGQSLCEPISGRAMCYPRTVVGEFLLCGRLYTLIRDSA